MKLSRTPVWQKDLSVGAKLARETGASISERPHRLYREQALLPRMPSGSRGLCLVELPPQACRYAFDGGVFPWASRADGTAPTVVPAVIGPLAIERVRLVVQHIDPQLGVPMAVAPGGGAKLAEVRGSGLDGLFGMTGLPGGVDGVGLVVGVDGGMGGSGAEGSGGRWTAQALRPMTSVSRVIRAMAVMVRIPVICPGCRWSIAVAPWCCSPGAGCGRSTHPRSADRPGRYAPSVGLRGSSTVSTAASWRPRRSVLP